jgi:hypothetical protein
MHRTPHSVHLPLLLAHFCTTGAYTTHHKENHTHRHCTVQVLRQLGQEVHGRHGHVPDTHVGVYQGMQSEQDPTRGGPRLAVRHPQHAEGQQGRLNCRRHRGVVLGNIQ